MIEPTSRMMPSEQRKSDGVQHERFANVRFSAQDRQMGSLSFFRRHVVATVLLLAGVVIGGIDAVGRVEQIESWGWLTKWGEPVAVALLVLAIIVFFYKIDKMVSENALEKSQVNRGVPADRPAPRDWVGLIHIEDEFGDGGLLRSRSAAYAHKQDMEKEKERIDAALQTSLDDMVSSSAYSSNEDNVKYEDAAKRHDTYMALVQTAEKIILNANSKYSTAEFRVKHDLKNKLLRGEIIARGFLVPHVAGADPQNIPSAEWDLLTFDEWEGSAEGVGVKYVGVRVAKLTPRAPERKLNRAHAVLSNVRQWRTGIGRKTPP